MSKTGSICGGHDVSAPQALLMAMQRLNALEDILCPADAPEITMDELREMCIAKREGRMVVLPCKVGTVIWTTRWWDMVKEKCTDSNGKPFYREHMKRKVQKGTYDPFSLDYIEFGKDVFLTRPEAEAALAREGEKQ